MTNKINRTIFEKKKVQYEKILNKEKVPGVSFEEVYNIASKNKRKSFMESGFMEKISLGAEENFKDNLKKYFPNKYDYLLKLRKENSKLYERELNGIIDESKLKKEYIDGFLNLSCNEDNLFLREAFEIVYNRNRKRKNKSLEKKLHNQKILVNFALLFDELSNQNFNQSKFEQHISDLENGKELNIFYYVCLRFVNENGNLDISDNLNPVKFKDINCEDKFRLGYSKKYQLDIIREMNNLTKDFNVNHKVIIPDFDLCKFGENDKKLFSKSERYVNQVKSYLGEEIEVFGNIDYFSEKINIGKYWEIYKSIQDNSNVFFNKMEFQNMLKSNMNKFSKTLTPWNENKNLEYTLHSIVRNMLEGEFFSKTGKNNSIVLFNRRIKVAETFNSQSDKKVPVFAFPIYYDNKGGYDLA